MIVPTLVNASSFSDAKQIANNYQSKFLTPDRYLVSSTTTWGLDSNAKPVKINGFSTGGLITQKEIEITRKKNTNPMSFSYIYDGTKIWTIENKIVSENFISGSNAKTKVTEYVKHDTTVSGIGTFEDPWIFVDSYRVTVKAIEHGKIDGQAISEKPVAAGGRVTFSIDSNSGYIYLDNTCGRDAIYNEETEELTISKVSKDMVCEVRFDETKYNYQFPTPCKKVTTLKYGERNHCFSNAVPRRFYVNYLKGYYQDKNYTKRLGQITIPALTGWVFDRFKVGNTTLVDNKGVFESSYGLFNDSSSDSSIGFEIHEKKYTVNLDFQGGTGGTPSIVATYDHDFPSVTVIPRKPGWVFIGYYSSTSGGTKYLNGNGKADNTCEPWNQDVANPTIYAQYRKCYKGNKCPLGNDETPCPVGTHQDEEGQTSCKLCPVGTYNNSLGQVYCTKCSPGYYQNEKGQTSCKACGIGKYQNEEGQTTCKDCPAGRYNNTTGQAECACCPGGQYQPNQGQTSCLTCGKGTYSPGCASSCTDCAAGTYQPSVGQSSCIPCSPGMYNTSPRLTSCHNCPAGKYQDQPGQTYCNGCAAGYYSQAGAATCTICPEGTYSTDNGVGCRSCVANSYCTKGISNPCPSGYTGPAGSASINNCSRIRYTKIYWTRSATGSCTCEGWGDPTGMGLCTDASCWDNGPGTCTMTGCSCPNGWSVWKNNCGVSGWSSSSNNNSFVYGSCSGSGGGDGQNWKYTCSAPSTVYYPD